MPPKALRGDRLIQTREKHGLSQRELSHRIGTGREQIGRYERGEADPTPYLLARIAKELRVTTDYLLGLVDEPNAHLRESDLTPDEQQFLTALREGKIRTLLRLIEQAVPEEQEQSNVPSTDVAADGNSLDTVPRKVPR